MIFIVLSLILAINRGGSASFSISPNCIPVLETNLPEFEDVLRILAESTLLDSAFVSDLPHIITNHGDSDCRTTLGLSKILALRWAWPTDCIWVYIVSLDPHFIVNAIHAWGPNLSESSAILVPVTEPWTNDTRQLLNRDAFGPVQPPIVFIDLPTSEWQLFCILCSDPFEPEPVSFSDTDFRRVHRIYNGMGHGSVAYLNRIGFRSEIKPGEEGYRYHTQLETNGWFKHEPEVSRNGVVLGILMKLLNFTTKREGWSTAVGNYSGIYLSPGDDLPVLHAYGRQLILTHKLEEFFLYCRERPIIPATGWDFFTHPFDVYIWIGITLTSLAFILVHRSISHGVDVLWAVLGLPPPNPHKWRHSKLVSCLFITTIVLNCEYLSVITSRVIIPNQEADIETPTELFRQGFRFIDGDGNTTRYSDYYKINFNKWSIGTAPRENVYAVPLNDSCPFTHNPACIAKWAGKATGLIYTRFKEQFILEIEPVELREKCHGVRVPWREFWVTFYEQGPLANVIYRIHSALLAGGIDVIWDRLDIEGSLVAAWKKASWRHNKDPPSLNFETPVLVVFKAYGVLIAVCVLVFLLELVLGRVAVFWRRSRAEFEELSAVASMWMK